MSGMTERAARWTPSKLVDYREGNIRHWGKERWDYGGGRLTAYYLPWLNVIALDKASACRVTGRAWESIRKMPYLEVNLDTLPLDTLATIEQTAQTDPEGQRFKTKIFKQA